MEYPIQVYSEPEYRVGVDLEDEYIVRILTDSLKFMQAGFTNRLRVYLSKVNNDHSVTTPDDATLFAAICEKTPVAKVIGATAATPIEITTEAAHGLSTGDKVVIDDLIGVYEAVGKFTITVTSATTFTLDGTTGTGAFIATGGRHVYRCLSGLDAVAMSYIAGTSGEYSALLSANIPIVTNGSYKIFVWDTGAYAGKFLASQDIQAK